MEGFFLALVTQNKSDEQYVCFFRRVFCVHSDQCKIETYKHHRTICNREHKIAPKKRKEKSITLILLFVVTIEVSIEIYIFPFSFSVHQNH